MAPFILSFVNIPSLDLQSREEVLLVSEPCLSFCFEYYNYTFEIVLCGMLVWPGVSCKLK
ncbi:hypothetical protein M6B38_100405 [Iris pallida]|uniref:Uncharacterized protein n=1 Tax=Iris pallida TaxID=29817 RepID=A0AAX6ILW5_IRIPA|nr:hypothetical protein M6B38_403670 [Iris pallida]KAJ6853973.1 hypothetical protein M6B38_100405 [Iris pallida]